jgi:hypothetical protein
VIRSVGDEYEPRCFPVFAPMVIAAIGNQAETIEDRSIIIELQRKKASERTESFRTDRAGEAGLLARQCARWTADNIFDLGAADPDMPDALYNRAADNWRPLLAVADAIGGSRPESGRNCQRTSPARSPAQQAAATATVPSQGGSRPPSAEISAWRGGAHYNPLQKLTYLCVIGALLPVMILTGLTMSPGMDAILPWLVDIFGYAGI